MVQQLLYKNSSNENTVLARLQGSLPSGAYRLKRARAKFRIRDIDKISFIADGSLFKNIPRDEANDFGTSDPAIFFQGRRDTGLAVQSVDAGNDTVTVSGDHREDFEEGGAIEISGSTGNDGWYKVLDKASTAYDSNNNETTISVEEDITDSTADGSIDIWENIFRGYAENQGKITSSGDLKFKLYGFGRYYAKEDVSISSISTTIKDVMSNLTPGNITLDAPSSSNVSYLDSSGNSQTGFAPVDNWSLNDLRGVGIREIARKYGYAVKWKADRTLRFEPIGFGAAIDTIDNYNSEGNTGNTQGKWIEWTADNTDLNINTVRVINNKDGNTYDSGVITNSTSVNQYGKITPEDGLIKNVGYIDSDDEAKRVAYNLVSKDGQNPTEGGRVAIPGRYTNNVVNSSFILNNSNRGIDSDNFIAWSQVNFYPENRSELHFQFESHIEEEKGIRDDVRGQRSQSFSTSFSNISGSTETVSDEYDEHNASQHPHDVGGKDSETAGGGAVIEDDDVTTTNLTPSTSFQQIGSSSIDFGPAAGMLITIHPRLSSSQTGADVGLFDIRVKDGGGNVILPANPDNTTSGYPKMTVGYDASPLWGDKSIVIPNTISDGETITVEARLNDIGNYPSSFTNLDWVVTYHSFDEHFHTMQAETDRAQNKADNSNNNTNTNDSTAGDTSSLDTSGSTDNEVAGAVKKRDR